MRVVSSLLLVSLVACSPPLDDKSLQRASLYVPPPVSPVVTRPTANTTPVLTPLVAPPLPEHTALRRVSFRATPSFRDGALAVLTSEQLDAVDRIFLGRLDLHAFVQADSTAHVWLAGDRVRAADIMLKDGRRLRVGWYPGSPAAAPGWYDQDGLSLESQILGRPVALSRVTSRFGERLHPITGKLKQHRGIDYGAPEGTPVYAVGSGTIKTLATDAAAGNHIKISHDSDFESWYLHLHHFAPGVVQGGRIEQGEVIGYVGTTGASTGPHLHYELHRNGLALDPQKKLALSLRALGPLSQPQHRNALEALP